MVSKKAFFWYNVAMTENLILISGMALRKNEWALRKLLSVSVLRNRFFFPFHEL